MPLSAAAQQYLLDLARNAVREAVGLPSTPPGPVPPAWRDGPPQGAFVTLHRRGRLRGCIGMVESPFPLAVTVERMARAAATQDSRFAPVGANEAADLDLELSLLSPLVRVSSAKMIRLGTDGVLVRKGACSGVFLPQVAAETGWDLETFLNCLCADKAGLPPGAWQDEDTELYTFTAERVQGPLSPR